MSFDRTSDSKLSAELSAESLSKLFGEATHQLPFQVTEDHLLNSGKALSATYGQGGGVMGETYSSHLRALQLEGLRILLVEDSPDNQKLFQRFLGGAGASVDLACNGEEGVQMQKQHCYDLIVMDIRMPVLDGYQATRLIRDNGFHKPIIALTAHATPGEEQRCRSSGCSDFLLKPIDRLGLLKAVCVAAARS